MGNQIDSASGSAIISIAFPENGALRARKVVKRSGTRGTGKFPSWKVKRMVQWESPHERNAILLLDADPNVLAFNEQPCAITYLLDGQEHTHFPDMLVRYANKDDFWEVKTAAYAAQPDVKQRTVLMQSALPTLGYGYHMVIAEELAFKPRLKTVNTLLRLGRKPVPLVEWEKIRLILAQTGGIPWQTAVDGHLGKNGCQHLCRLVLEGYLYIDINQALSGTTVFKLR